MACFKEGTDLKKRMSINAFALDEMVRLPLEQKIEISLDLMKTSDHYFGNDQIIASSWGKDSTVMVHMALQVNPRASIVFVNTGVEFPETLAHHDRLVKEWSIGNDHIISPARTFFSIAREYGLPGSSRMKTRVPKCCQELKEKPMLHFIREYGFKSIAVGILANESQMRRFTTLRDGPFYYAKSYWKSFKVHPLTWWTDEDIWAYHDLYDIPRNEAYKKYNIERTGCMTCTGHIGWEKQIQEISPILYKQIQKLNGQTLIEAFV